MYTEGLISLVNPAEFWADGRPVTLFLRCISTKDSKDTTNISLGSSTP